MVDVDTTLPKQVYVGIRNYLAIIMPTEPSCTFLVRRHNRNCQKVSLKMAETFDELLRTLVFQKHFGQWSKIGYVPPGAVSGSSTSNDEEDKELAQFFTACASICYAKTRSEVLAIVYCVLSGRGI